VNFGTESLTIERQTAGKNVIEAGVLLIEADRPERRNFTTKDTKEHKGNPQFLAFVDLRALCGK
jgi:hypothetical protein